MSNLVDCWKIGVSLENVTTTEGWDRNQTAGGENRRKGKIGSPFEHI